MGDLVNLPRRWRTKRNGYCRFGLHRWIKTDVEVFGAGTVLLIKCKVCPAESAVIEGVWR